MLFWDKETRSACDLKERGLGPYVEDPSTELILASFAFDDGPVATWMAGTPVPDSVLAYLSTGGNERKIIAHNAAFEWAIWNYVGPRYGLPPVPFERFICTQALAYALAIPASLEKAALAMGLDKQKDMVGSRLMMKMCKPKSRNEAGVYSWHEEPEDLKRLAAYCEQDVETERELYKRLVQLSASEQEMFYLDHKINQRGIKVDLPSIEKAIEIAARETKRLDEEINAATAGRVSRCSQSVALAEWIREQGVNCDGVAKADVTELLTVPGLPEPVRLALECRKAAAKSSVAKLESMRNRASKDSRVRGTMQYHGAGQTGRWAGRGIQIHNFPRGSSDPGHIEETFRQIQNGVGNLEQISNALRGFIIAGEGKRLISVDFASVESRIIAWLSGEESKLDIFRSGKDPYIYLASKIYKIPYEEVTKDLRLVGKVSELACGFQGGVGALQVMATTYGIKKEEWEWEEIKCAWRASHPNIENFWYKMERAAIAAVRNPGTVFKVSGPTIGGPVIAYKKVGSFLFCKLPSGRKISYPYPKVEELSFTHPLTKQVVTKSGLTYMGENSYGTERQREKAYGGLLSENVTQAVGRDLLSEALKRCESQGYPIVFHVHDEGVAEVATDRGSLAEMEKIFSVVPAWATGLPIEASGWEGKRYRK